MFRVSYGKEFPLGETFLPATYGASPIPGGMEPAIKPQRAPGIFPGRIVSSGSVTPPEAP